MASTEIANKTVVGYFEDNADARSAVEALHSAGFSSAHLGVAHRGEYGATTPTEASHETGGTWDKIKSFFSGDSESSSSGLTSGSAPMKGSPVEPYADERIDGEFADREITPSTHQSNAYGSYEQHTEYEDTAPSDIHHSLNEMSVPEDRSKYFGHRFNSGERSAIVTVQAGERAVEAESILKEYGADLGDNAAEYDYDSGYDATATGAGAAGIEREPRADRTESNRIQLLGEVLRVHKQRVERGEVRIRKEVVTENQTVQVPVSREELVIERFAGGDRSATGTVGESKEIRIPLSEERAVIDKSTVVREEVAIGKKAVENTENVSDEVRHEELVVEDETTRGR